MWKAVTSPKWPGKPWKPADFCNTPAFSYTFCIHEKTPGRNLPSGGFPFYSKYCPVSLYSSCPAPQSFTMGYVPSPGAPRHCREYGLHGGLPQRRYTPGQQPRQSRFRRGLHRWAASPPAHPRAGEPERLSPCSMQRHDPGSCRSPHPHPAPSCGPGRLPRSQSRC